MALIIILICASVWHQYIVYAEECIENYNLNFGQSYILQSPGFNEGKYYTSGMSCEWTFHTSPGYVFDISCSPIDMPQSDQCNQDRLVISFTEDELQNDGRRYCGVQTLKLISSGNALKIALVSAAYSNGGRFRCIISPIGGGINTPPPETTTETSKPDCECGWQHERKIVGGRETEVNEFPFMAALIYYTRKTIWCGASIISDRYALTAAHCIYQTEWTQFLLLVGDHDIKKGDETDKAKLYILEDYIPHEFYIPSIQYNDIALVKTAEPIAFSMEVGPICLPYRYIKTNFTHAPVTVMGWGLHEYSGIKSDTLNSVNLTVVALQDCKTAYYGNVIDDTKMCTFARGKDACQFDSGGPIVWYDNYNTHRYQLLGVISFGYFCATDVPSVNTNLSHYFHWILNNSPDATYCFK